MAQTAWDNVDLDFIEMGFKSAGMGLPLDGTEDDAIIQGLQDNTYEEKLERQRKRTVEHERTLHRSKEVHRDLALKAAKKTRKDAMKKTRQGRKLHALLRVPGVEDAMEDAMENAETLRVEDEDQKEMVIDAD